MPQREYKPEQRDFFEIYLKSLGKSGTVAAAAKYCGIDIGTAKFWAAQMPKLGDFPDLEDKEETAPQASEATGNAAAMEERDGRKRPKAPPQLLSEPFDDSEIDFIPDHYAIQWLLDTFVSEDGPLWDEKLWHLKLARIGVLWTNMPHPKACAQARLPKGMGEAWTKGMAETQMRKWFGDLPDYVIIFYAPICSLAKDRLFVSIAHHELLHCGIKWGEEGPCMKDDGRPVAIMNEHHVQEFVDCIDLYGVEVGAGQSVAFVEAGNRRPKVSDAQIEAACGPEDDETDGESDFDTDDTHEPDADDGSSEGADD